MLRARVLSVVPSGFGRHKGVSMQALVRSIPVVVKLFHRIPPVLTLELVIKVLKGVQCYRKHCTCKSR
jgi:hypothetical protein